MQQKLDNITQYLPKPYKKRRYYTPQDVKIHNTANDCWVSFFNKVYDLTELIQQNISSIYCKPLIEVAGNDITYWFDNDSKEPRKQIDINKGELVYYCPQGQYLHVVDMSNQDQDTPWWKNQKYFIGVLTIKSRKIKIVNMLSHHEDILEIPSEETINEILDRYKIINFHAASYTWKRIKVPLDMEKNLEENGIQDETEEFQELDIPEDQWYIPAIHLYFNDDLTII
ncbi:hypothetical protein IMG5_051740 [Ichthyophthirius multifiliis]|uniref:Cytochrome b5 domain-containing protein 1 n=1 Tax=Ichthyophthirius multifiliis TaxID=5932 RepID=G0QMU2_ICHMU|nr:hypothetical protein IMG5_051740 [Ichthyophthirius multifiliis]EGR33495.1 hypothetical protein IMG5_051740 [Ichthyophthirius multifiliis]|eukprot:XP_004037481.1 hypothetical protein IMG5_051740 [Ichthyophthirius multifiliis]